MIEEEGSIGALRLPQALVRAIRQGRWKAPDQKILTRVFDYDPEDPRFYDLSQMAFENEAFQGWSQAELYEHLYVPDPGIGVDPAKAVIIGDLGVDSPIVLDYRVSQSRPRVIHLTIGGWREIAPDIEILLERLGADLS